MTSFFISDIHLSESNNKLSSAFINFLKDSKESCSQLYILGDLFEVWIGDDYETSFINDMKSELLRFTTNGPDTFLMHGNRDFLISEKFLTDTGIKLLPDPFEITMHNKKVLLSHGDFLCTDDVDYINFRNQVRDKAWQDNFLSKSIEERNEIASKLRSDSNDATQGKSLEITDVNESSVKKIIEDNFNLSPRGIREILNLNNPIYEITSAYGHFGRKFTNKGEFTWEKTDKTDLFKL